MSDPAIQSEGALALPNSAPPYPHVWQLGKQKSGLLFLRDGVEEYFRSRSIPIEVARVGAKFRSFKLNQSPFGANRVVFIPGDYDAASGQTKARPYGTLSRATRNASSVVNPRELVSWERPITISIWSAPKPGTPEAEDDSIAVVEDMLEQVVRACQFVQASQIVFGEVTIVAPPVEQSFGCELLVSAIQRGPLCDETLEYTQATAVVPRTQIGG